MGCLPRFAALLTIGLLALAVTTPASALQVEWRQPRVSQLDAMKAELIPLHVEVLQADADLGLAIRQLNITVGDLRFDEIVSATETTRDVFERLQAAAIAGMVVLDRYAPEPCFLDYYVIERTGFMAIGDGVSGLAAGDPGSAQYYNVGAWLLLTRADLALKETDCG